MVTLKNGRLSVVLAPDLGGSVLAFDLNDGGVRVPLFRRAPDHANHVLQVASFPVVPFANRIRNGRFTVDGREIRLAPNMGGEKYPLHGQGWRSRWRVEKASASEAELSFSHPAGEWPWRYIARQHFALSEQALDIALTCRNMSESAMPCGLGQHPYLPCDTETILDLKAEGVWTIDHDVLPVARAPATGRYDLRQRRICAAGLDNGFDGWNGRAEILWPACKYGLRITSDGTRLQVYAPASGGFFVAGPVTNQNAAFNLPQAQWGAAGITLLKPGEQLRFRTRFELRSV